MPGEDTRNHAAARRARATRLLGSSRLASHTERDTKNPDRATIWKLRLPRERSSHSRRGANRYIRVASSLHLAAACEQLLWF